MVIDIGIQLRDIHTSTEEVTIGFLPWSTQQKGAQATIPFPRPEVEVVDFVGQQTGNLHVPSDLHIHLCLYPFDLRNCLLDHVDCNYCSSGRLLAEHLIEIKPEAVELPSDSRVGLS